MRNCKRFAVYQTNPLEWIELEDLNHPQGVPCECEGCKLGVDPSGAPLRVPSMTRVRGAFAGAAWGPARSEEARRMRVSKDETWLAVARVLAKRSTCARRAVGCVLLDHNDHVISTGYNGPAAGQTHCIDSPCPGAGAVSGEDLDLCEAVHAEQNALIQCSDERRIARCYVTSSPCRGCIKILLNTACQVIVFSEMYAHEDARSLWIRSGRLWVHRFTVGENE